MIRSKELSSTLIESPVVYRHRKSCRLQASKVLSLTGIESPAADRHRKSCRLQATKSSAVAGNASISEPASMAPYKSPARQATSQLVSLLQWHLHSELATKGMKVIAGKEERISGHLAVRTLLLEGGG